MSVEFWVGLAVGLFLLYWCFNSLKMLVGLLWGFILSWYKVHTSHKYKHQDYWVIESDTDEAFTYGLLNPQIYISSSLVNRLSKEKLDMIIRHEQIHQKEYDPFKNYITQVIRSILPPMLFKTELFRIYTVLTELTADQHALKRVDDRKTLLNLLHELSSNDKKLLVGFTSGYNRINLINGTTALNIKLICALVTSILVISIINVILSVNAQSPYLCKTSNALNLNALDGSQVTAQVCTDSNSNECVQLPQFSAENHMQKQNQSIYLQFSPAN